MCLHCPSFIWLSFRFTPSLSNKYDIHIMATSEFYLFWLSCGVHLLLMIRGRSRARTLVFVRLLLALWSFYAGKAASKILPMRSLPQVEENVSAHVRIHLYGCSVRMFSCSFMVIDQALQRSLFGAPFLLQGSPWLLKKRQSQPKRWWTK